MQNVIKTIVLLLLMNSSLFAKYNDIEASVSLVSMSMDYRETDKNGNIANTEQSPLGDLIGLHIHLELPILRKLQNATSIQANATMLAGKTTYTGSYIAPGSNFGDVIEKHEQSILDLDILIQQSHIFNEDMEFKYSMGLGYRFWKRDLSTSQNRQIEDYVWFSLRGMLGLSYDIDSRFTIGSEFEYQYGFEDTMYATNIKTTFDLGSANIFRISVPLSYEYTKKVDFLFTLVYEQQEIGVSNVINNYYEPQSTAKNKYLRIGANFKF